MQLFGFSTPGPQLRLSSYLLGRVGVSLHANVVEIGLPILNRDISRSSGGGGRLFIFLILDSESRSRSNDRGYFCLPLPAQITRPGNRDS